MSYKPKDYGSNIGYNLYNIVDHSNTLDKSRTADNTRNTINNTTN